MSCLTKLKQQESRTGRAICSQSPCLWEMNFKPDGKAREGSRESAREEKRWPVRESPRTFQNRPIQKLPIELLDQNPLGAFVIPEKILRLKTNAGSKIWPSCAALRQSLPNVALQQKAPRPGSLAMIRFTDLSRLLDTPQKNIATRPVAGSTIIILSVLLHFLTWRYERVLLKVGAN